MREISFSGGKLSLARKDFKWNVAVFILIFGRILRDWGKMAIRIVRRGTVESKRWGNKIRLYIWEAWGAFKTKVRIQEKKIKEIFLNDANLRVFFCSSVSRPFQLSICAPKIVDCNFKWFLQHKLRVSFNKKVSF